MPLARLQEARWCVRILRAVHVPASPHQLATGPSRKGLGALRRALQKFSKFGSRENPAIVTCDGDPLDSLLD
jgi:hypothetical protein